MSAGGVTFQVFSAVPGARRFNGNLKEKEGGVVPNYTLEREHTATDCTQQNGPLMNGLRLTRVDDSRIRDIKAAAEGENQLLTTGQKDTFQKLRVNLLSGVKKMDDNENQKFSVQRCVYTEPFIQLVH
ncbi:hypothetical protein F2P79_005515 [Pimephales promelas]|nr:hypothetical protein F2P79_005515 [Pimephales promelas]